MDDHLSEDMIARYRSRKLNADELKTFDRHLAECDACAEQIAGSNERKDTAMTLLSEWGGSPDHLTYEQLKTYLENGPSSRDRDQIDAHLADCTRCRGDLENLKTLHKTLPDEIYRMNALAAELMQAAPATQPGERQRRIGFGLPALAGSALAALVVWLGVAQPEFNQVTHLQKQNRELAQQNRAAQQELAVANRVKDQAALAQKERDRASKEALRLLAQNRQFAQKVAQVNGQLRKQQQENALVRQDYAQVKAERDRLRTQLPPGTAQDASLAGVVAKAMQTDTMPVRIAANLGGNVGGIRGDVSPKSPVGTTVMSDQPTLSWYTDSNFTNYGIEVYRVKNGQSEQRPIRQGKTDGNTWEVVPPLKRGETFEWRLSAQQTDGGKAALPNTKWPRFQVASQAAARNFAGEQIRHAILLSALGLPDQAAQALQDAVSAHAGAELTARAERLQHSLQTQLKARSAKGRTLRPHGK